MKILGVLSLLFIGSTCVLACDETAYERGIREEIERRHEIQLEEKKLEVLARLEMLQSQNINVNSYTSVKQKVKSIAENS